MAVHVGYESEGSFSPGTSKESGMAGKTGKVAFRWLHAAGSSVNHRKCAWAALRSGRTNVELFHGHDHYR